MLPGSAADAFRSAVVDHRVDDIEALLAPDVVFNSPVVHRTYHGRDQLMAVLHAVVEVVEDFRYDADYAGGDGGVVLRFSGRVGDRDLQGVDILALDGDGRIAELTVMMRPLSALTVLRDAMAAKLAGA